MPIPKGYPYENFGQKNLSDFFHKKLIRYSLKYIETYHNIHFVYQLSRYSLKYIETYHNIHFVYQLIDPLKIREDLENVIVSDLFMMILWKYFDPNLISICQNLD